MSLQSYCPLPPFICCITPSRIKKEFSTLLRFRSSSSSSGIQFTRLSIFGRTRTRRSMKTIQVRSNASCNTSNASSTARRRSSNGAGRTNRIRWSTSKIIQATATTSGATKSTTCISGISDGISSAKKMIGKAPVSGLPNYSEYRSSSA